jgi:thiol-disulfide isomerase/thioredoxin
MSRKVLGIIAAVILAIGGGVVYLVNDTAGDDAVPKTVGSVTQPSNQTQTSQQPASQQPGAYVDYSQSVIADTAGTKMLFFHAPWCPQCRALEADIQQNGVPSGVTIIKVDYDTNQSLRQKYGVTIQTTFVRIDDAGNLIEKYVAYDKPTINAVVENLL